MILKALCAMPPLTAMVMWSQLVPIREIAVPVIVEVSPSLHLETVATVLVSFSEHILYTYNIVLQGYASTTIH